MVTGLMEAGLQDDLSLHLSWPCIVRTSLPLPPSSLFPYLPMGHCLCIHSATSVLTLPWPFSEGEQELPMSFAGEALLELLNASDVCISYILAVLEWKRRRPQTLTYTTARTVRKPMGSLPVSTNHTTTPWI